MVLMPARTTVILYKSGLSLVLTLGRTLVISYKLCRNLVLMLARTLVIFYKSGGNVILMVASTVVLNSLESCQDFEGSALAVLLLKISLDPLCVYHC